MIEDLSLVRDPPAARRLYSSTFPDNPVFSQIYSLNSISSWCVIPGGDGEINAVLRMDGQQNWFVYNFDTGEEITRKPEVGDRLEFDLGHRRITVPFLGPRANGYYPMVTDGTYLWVLSTDETSADEVSLEFKCSV